MTATEQISEWIKKNNMKANNDKTKETSIYHAKQPKLCQPITL